MTLFTERLLFKESLFYSILPLEEVEPLCSLGS